MESRKIEFWFSYGSTYTYLSVARIGELAKAKNIEIEWRPFYVKVIAQELGMPKGPFGSNPPKLNYMWRDLERRAALYGLPYCKPSVYPVPYDLTAKVGLLAQEEGWCGEFTKLVFDWHFTEGRTIGGEGNLTEALSFLEKDSENYIDRASTEKTSKALLEQTEVAKRQGVFGSPSFIVDKELFWGDDRLEDALNWAVGSFVL